MNDVTFADILQKFWFPVQRKKIFDEKEVFSPKLFDYQRDGVQMARRIIDRFGGALIADEVGLGKSYEALTVAREMCGSIWITCPANLIQQWKKLIKLFEMNATIVSHSKLSRHTDPLPAENAFLIVDEAHRFRNPSTRRYIRLAEHCVGRRVLLLTATPIQNSPRDLIWLLRLFLGWAVLKTFTGLSKQEILTNKNISLSQLVVNFIIRRTREMIAQTEFHANCYWPIRNKLIIKEQNTPIGVDLTESVRAAMLSSEPSSLFVKVYLKRLASSPEAARDTVRRCRAYLARLEEAKEVDGWLSRQAFRAAFGNDPAFQGSQMVFPFWYANSSFEISDLSARIAKLDQVERALSLTKITATSRLKKIKNLIQKHRRLIIFTEYTSTAKALFSALKHTINALLWTGSIRRVSNGSSISSQKILLYFEHLSSEEKPVVLIATNVAAEGLNLQIAHAVIHFDLPWNPAKITQRAGRIDRVGGQRIIYEIICQPHAAIEKKLQLLQRLELKQNDIHHVYKTFKTYHFLLKKPMIKTIKTNMWIYDNSIQNDSWWILTDNILLTVQSDKNSEKIKQTNLQTIPISLLLRPMKKEKETFWRFQANRIIKQWHFTRTIQKTKQMQKGVQGALIRMLLRQSAIFEQSGQLERVKIYSDALNALSCDPTIGVELLIEKTLHQCRSENVGKCLHIVENLTKQIVAVFHLQKNKTQQDIIIIAPDK